MQQAIPWTAGMRDQRHGSGIPSRVPVKFLSRHNNEHHEQRKDKAEKGQARI